MAKLKRWGRRDRVDQEPAPEPDEQLDAELAEADLERVPAGETAGETAGGTAGGTAGESAGGTAPSASTAGAAGAAGATAVEALDTDPDRAEGGRRSRLALTVRRSQPVSLLEASHPRQALVTATFLGIAALASERPPREAVVVAATALVGQAVLGWHNDLVDRARDRRHGTPRKPLADGRLEPGSVWYALVVAVLLVVPLSISTGVTAGSFYLGALAVGLLGNVVLRRGKLSFLPWAVQFALYVPYLSYGGWGGGADGSPPEPVMVGLFALLGIGVHVLRAIWGLVADDADRWTYLPLVLGRRMGATRLLAVAAAYTFVVVTAIVVVGGTTGLRR